MAATTRPMQTLGRLLQVLKEGKIQQRCFHQTGLNRQASNLTLSKQENGIRTITLNNPKQRNTLSLVMLDHLKADIEAGLDTNDLRVIVINAEGPVFSAGHDLKELTSKDGREHHVKVFTRCTEVMTMIQDIPVPVIAEVKGFATAAGCQLVASCDMAVAGENAKFATPGVNVGLFCSTPAVALARAVPRKLAMEMLFTGHPIPADVALRHGLVSKVVPEDALHEEVTKIAKRICETSKSVVALGKACFYEQIAMDRNSAYRKASGVMVDNLALKDGQEGIAAFAKKRQPVWSHGTTKADE